MDSKSPRVRFAPAPTGLMHLGNVRTALMNYLFAKQKTGTFILRIEDTDPKRNFDPGAKKIIEDLQWLGLYYNEGPIKGGPYAPYFQSERTALYQEKLNQLKDKGLVYRCFCTLEELRKKRQQQLMLKLPPRYDRTCLGLSESKIQDRLDKNTPFIWRMKLDINQTIKVLDLARGTIQFDLKHFSDFPLTRQDGSFTFIFANCVDDAVMKITHVLRGEDHLTNTANQAVLYQAFDITLPLFWHLPILCNTEGKKLSKRDFGFTLQDLKGSGFLPEAICNYLAIIGGGIFEQEIMSLEELVKTINFDNIHSTGYVRYDIEKLRWINHKWIDRYDFKKLAQVARPFLEKQFPKATELGDPKLAQLLQTIKTDLITLQDVPNTLHFYFEKPDITTKMLTQHIPNQLQPLIASIITKQLHTIGDPDTFTEVIKQEAKKIKIPLQTIFAAVRIALIGSAQGPSIHDLVDMLGSKEASHRIKNVLQSFKK
ncbi:glutamate--tRNA ligase [Candidatus Dependentiae bacterium]|nr:MAG: glutamate--tRNA ligase [Candidatus Dependentiae bacterium]